MSTFYLIGNKTYDGSLFDLLAKAPFKDDLSKPHSKKLDILMYEVSLGEQRSIDLDEVYGEHYHYTLVNDNARELLLQLGAQLKITATLEIDDPMRQGFALLVRSVRYI